MGTKGLDFKHKEVVNIVDGRRLGYVQDVTADLESGIITSIMVARKRIDGVGLCLRGNRREKVIQQGRERKGQAM